MITDKVKSFEDACAVLGIAPESVIPYANPKDQEEVATNAYRKLTTIAKALNEGWQPNWNDHDEWKYQPWFEVEASEEKPAGSGFSITDYGGWRTTTYVGSRLCFKSSALALYAGKQFADIYKDYLLFS